MFKNVATNENTHTEAQFNILNKEEMQSNINANNVSIRLRLLFNINR